MKSYYQDESVTIYHGDCADILPSIYHEGSFVTDPPYGIGFKYTDSFFDSSQHLTERLNLLKNESVALLQYPEEMMRFVVPVLGVPNEVIAWVYNSFREYALDKQCPSATVET